MVPSLVRTAKNDYVVNDKFVIEKGTPVIIPATAIHMDPEFYPNPEQFNPDNFSAENVKQRESLTMLGFGEGPRNCIGLRFGQMQSRLGLAMLLKNFKFSVGPSTQIPVIFDKHASLGTCKGGILLETKVN